MLIEILQSQCALFAVKEEWRALSSSQPKSIGFFGGWDFAWYYIEAIKPKKWFVVLLRDSEKKKLVAAFAWELINLKAGDVTYRAVQPLGPSLVPYVEYSVESKYLRAGLQVLFNTVFAQQVGVDVVCLWPLHEASPLYNALVEDLRGSEALKTFRYPGKDQKDTHFNCPNKQHPLN